MHWLMRILLKAIVFYAGPGDAACRDGLRRMVESLRSQRNSSRCQHLSSSISSTLWSSKS